MSSTIEVTTLNDLQINRAFKEVLLENGLVTLEAVMALKDLEIVKQAVKERRTAKVVLKDGFIVGMTFVGRIDKSGIIFGLMKDRVDVREFKESLLADEFGMASLPQEVWRQRFGMASGVGAGK